MPSPRDSTVAATSRRGNRPRVRVVDQHARVGQHGADPRHRDGRRARRRAATAPATKGAAAEVPDEVCGAARRAGRPDGEAGGEQVEGWPAVGERRHPLGAAEVAGADGVGVREAGGLGHAGGRALVARRHDHQHAERGELADGVRVAADTDGDESQWPPNRPLPEDTRERFTTSIGAPPWRSPMTWSSPARSEAVSATSRPLRMPKMRTATRPAPRATPWATPPPPRPDGDPGDVGAVEAQGRGCTAARRCPARSRWPTPGTGGARPARSTPRPSIAPANVGCEASTPVSSTATWRPWPSRPWADRDGNPEGGPGVVEDELELADRLDATRPAGRGAARRQPSAWPRRWRRRRRRGRRRPRPRPAGRCRRWWCPRPA